MADGETSKKMKKKYPQFERSFGAQILSLINENDEPTKIQVDKYFAADSLFCEWAYVVDLDKMTFEVYEGFNKTPLEESDRFFALQQEVERKEGDEYYAVKLIRGYRLDNLPSEETFLSELVVEYDEDDKEIPRNVPVWDGDPPTWDEKMTDYDVKGFDFSKVLFQDD